MARKPNTEIRNRVLALIAEKCTHSQISEILSKELGRKISAQLVSYYSKPVSF